MYNADDLVTNTLFSVSLPNDFLSDALNHEVELLYTFNEVVQIHFVWPQTMGISIILSNSQRFSPNSLVWTYQVTILSILTPIILYIQ